LHKRNLFFPGASGDDNPDSERAFSESEVTIMPQKLLDVLMLGRCSHEFSWPRRGADGNYYQVCLLCAAEYEYDWATMRRTDRVERPTQESFMRRNHPRDKRPSWKPRARRVKLDLPLRYRLNQTGPWHEGIIENISQSGVLFRGQESLSVNSLLEMVFEMPEEISGQKNSNVVCQGRVTRSTRGEAAPPNTSGGNGKESAEAPEENPVLAASIVDYKFVR
jgi:PilZ domain